MNSSITHYKSYLLRLWQESPQTQWHVSLQSVQSQEVIHFVDLDALLHFLWNHTISEPLEKVSNCELEEFQKE